MLESLALPTTTYVPAIASLSRASVVEESLLMARLLPATVSTFNVESSISLTVV